uniref:Uncharacterized protein n=1 Tax=Glossina palpalis gambiensis TaxID=67801 RepID=A0A1B0BDM4_9MUSC
MANNDLSYENQLKCPKAYMKVEFSPSPCSTIALMHGYFGILAICCCHGMLINYQRHDKLNIALSSGIGYKNQPKCYTCELLQIPLHHTLFLLKEK